MIWKQPGVRRGPRRSALAPRLRHGRPRDHVSGAGRLGVPHALDRPRPASCACCPAPGRRAAARSTRATRGRRAASSSRRSPATSRSTTATPCTRRRRPSRDDLAGLPGQRGDGLRAAGRAAPPRPQLQRGAAPARGRPGRAPDAASPSAPRLKRDDPARGRMAARERTPTRPRRRARLRRRAALARADASGSRTCTRTASSPSTTMAGWTQWCAVAGRPSGLGWLPDGRMLDRLDGGPQALPLRRRARSRRTPISPARSPRDQRPGGRRRGRAYVSQFGFDFASGASSRRPRSCW